MRTTIFGKHCIGYLNSSRRLLGRNDRISKAAVRWIIQPRKGEGLSFCEAYFQFGPIDEE